MIERSSYRVVCVDGRERALKRGHTAVIAAITAVEEVVFVGYVC